MSSFFACQPLLTRQTVALSTPVSPRKWCAEGGVVAGLARRKLLKQKNPALLSMLLGASSNVVTLQRAEGIRLKEARCSPCVT